MKKTICGHPSLLIVRGLCKPCYALRCRIVKDGSTSWDTLERMGDCLPARGAAEFLRKPSGEMIRVPFKGAKR